MRKAVFFLILAVIFSGAGRRSRFESFEILEAEMTSSFDRNRNPLDVRSEFPPAVEAIHCAFSWKGMEPGLNLTADWYFTSSNIQILVQPLSLTRNADRGIVSLKMPAGKHFPSGAYRVDFRVESRVLKSVSFKVLSEAEAK